MPIKTSDVRQTLLRDLNRHARKWAGHDGVVSKQEEESRIYSWERDTKLEVVREAITELRAEKGGEDVLVEEIVDRLLDRSEELWGQFNQQSGSGKAFLSRAEVAQVKEADEALGELTGKAWQSTHTEDINRRRAARAAEAREKLYNKPLATLDDWKALSPSERESIIDSIDYREQASLTYVTNQPIGDITDPQIKAFVDEMRDYMEDNGNMEVEDDNYALIGPVDIEVSVATLPTGEVVGGMIRFHQPGAMNDDNETGYFDTAAEAEAAGFDTDADVSWDAFGYFDVDGEPIRTDDYMEWSGH